MARPAQAIVNLAALRHNHRLARELSGSGQVMPVLKANAYGHGAVAVARALEVDAPALAVACIEEALELRSAGIGCPIALLEGCFTADELPVASAENFWVVVENRRQLGWIEEARLEHPLCCWLKVDTGMHRLGVAPEEVPEVYAALCASDNVAPGVVIASHLASADDLANDFSATQLRVFRQAVAGIRAPLSLSNSPGLLGWPQTRLDWNRPGFMLYGNSPFAGPQPEADKLRQVMTLKSAVIGIRDVAAGATVGYGNSWRAARASRIATVAMGYGDGYPRHAPAGTPVLVDGQRAELVGRVSMDMITVDVTGLPGVDLGTEVVLWGEAITANDIARHAGTIGYEVLTRMPLRTPRVYVDN
jgi:alanine racemase